MGDALHVRILQLAAKFSNHKIHFGKALCVLIALKPLEMPLNLVERIEHRSGKIYIEEHLIDNVARLESGSVAL